jgi:hypothetical protein
MSPYIHSLTLLAPPPPPLSPSSLPPYRYMKDLGVRCDHLGRVSLQEFIKYVLLLLSFVCLLIDKFVALFYMHILIIARHHMT